MGRLTVELLFNELSLHGQFPDVTTFKASVGRVMRIRKVMRRFGRDLYCRRNVPSCQVTSDKTMQQVIGAFDPNSKRALLGWLTGRGPFWEDEREHSGEEWFEYNGEIVTDSALGEAAYKYFCGLSQGVVSMAPSAWLSSPLLVKWVQNRETSSATIPNYWDVDTLRAVLDAAPAPIRSWTELETMARERCPDLMFAQDSFKPLAGHPFHEGTAKRLLDRFSRLHDLKNCFDERGERTSEGHRLYKAHFTGDGAHFSDSSDTEKRTFRTELTFPHPQVPGTSLFCTWHGKVVTRSRLQLRVHFSWPVRRDDPLYVVYVGPKITRR